MAAPISNNNPLLTEHRRAGNGTSEGAGSNNPAAAKNAETATQRQDDAVNVSNTAQALGSSSASQSSANIQNAEQAAELAQKIADFFTENGPAALAAHGNGSANLADLLKAS